MKERRGWRVILCQPALLERVITRGFDACVPENAPADLRIEDVTYSRRSSGHLIMIFVSSAQFCSDLERDAADGRVNAPEWNMTFRRKVETV